MSPNKAVQEIKRFVTMCKNFTEKKKERVNGSFFYHINIDSLGIMAYFEYHSYSSEDIKKDLLVSLYNNTNSKIIYKDFKYDLNYAMVYYPAILEKIKEVLNGLE